MCIRTVEGEDGFMRNISGIDVDVLRNISGEDLEEYRNISGLPPIPSIALLGTTPTFTTLSAISGSYSAPVGCVYIEVQLVGGGGGGGSGQAINLKNHGGGGGAGGSAFGYFQAGTYSYSVGAVGGGGGVGNNGSAGGTTSFGTMSATGGSGGSIPLVSGTDYFAAADGVATNSLIPFGSIPANPPGRAGANGGSSVLMGIGGRGAQCTTTTPDFYGDDGVRGGGGGGGMNDSYGGNGGQGVIFVTAYY